METNVYKHIRVDIETYNEIKRVAQQEGKTLLTVVKDRFSGSGGEGIEERVSSLEKQIQALANSPMGGAQMLGALLAGQPQTTDNGEPDIVEAYRNADDEERRDMLGEQVELVTELKRKKEKAEKPLKDYTHWEVVYREEKAIADYEGGDATLYEDSLREMQDVLEREGVGTKDELKKKIDDETAPLREEYEREKEILNKMRKNA